MEKPEMRQKHRKVTLNKLLGMEKKIMNYIYIAIIMITTCCISGCLRQNPFPPGFKQSYYPGSTLGPHYASDFIHKYVKKTFKSNAKMAPPTKVPFSS